MVKKPELSVIVVTYNSSRYVIECLSSIAQSARDVNFELVVVDNHSTEDTLALVHRHFPDIHLISNSENCGFARANNQGLRRSQGEFLLLVNPDVVILGDAIPSMLRFLRKSENTAAVGCRLLNADCTTQRSTFSYPTISKELFHILGGGRLLYLLGAGSSKGLSLLRRVSPRNFGTYWEHNKLAEVDGLTGACVMIKRKAIRECGEFDERFFMYNEERELFYRFKSDGWKVIFYPEARAIHYGGSKNVNSFDDVGLFLHWYTGIFLFFSKHYGPIKTWMLAFTLEIGAVMRILLSGLLSIPRSRGRSGFLLDLRKHVLLMGLVVTLMVRSHPGKP